MKFPLTPLALHTRVRPVDTAQAMLRGIGYVVSELGDEHPERYGVCWFKDVRFYKSPGGDSIAITPVEWWLPGELEAAP